MSLKKGQRLTSAGIDYELTRTVGGGGSGDVWIAEARANFWAVKVLRSDSNRTKIERFNREASFQESCGHDHIVPVVGRGEHESHPFYIMPYYPGTLRNVIDQGAADATTLLLYIEQIGLALQFAHERGVVHRDLKPENILVAGTFAALADFGIAHFMDSELTKPGDLVANRDYRAPEQQKGHDARDVGAAADVYALGLIVNECFTGQIPAGPSFASIEASHPLFFYLDDIVARMLEQDPGSRPSVVDVLTEIQFYEARKKDEIADIDEMLRQVDSDPQDDGERYEPLFRQASEDLWYAASLAASKSPAELERYNGNWHMRVGYSADAFLRNLCIQHRLLALCRHMFDYESNVYARGEAYKPLDIDGDPEHRELYTQAQSILSEHWLPPDSDLSGRILKTFASCADYHCREILRDARRTVKEVDENLLDAPILWILQYLLSHVPPIRELDDLADHVRINWRRSANFDQNDDDAELLTRAPTSSNPAKVLTEFKKSWDVSITRIEDGDCSVMFRTLSEYQRFRMYGLSLAEPNSLFAADLMDLFRSAQVAGGIIQLTLNLAFDVSNTLAKVLGLRDV